MNLIEGRKASITGLAEDYSGIPEGEATNGHSNGHGACNHFVQFYETHEFLAASVASFISAGLHSGEGAVVIATAAHRDAIAKGLRKEGIDPGKVEARGQYYSLDAAQTLETFMVNGSPDRSLFMKNVGEILKPLAAGRQGVRAFGEMVALLWEQGNGDAAIRLEELWNELGQVHTFRLFCAYPLQDFGHTSKRPAFDKICQTHSLVLPSEKYYWCNEADRLREIAALQQKAAALEEEIARRKRAEDRYHQLISLMPAGVYACDAQGRITFYNRRAAELWGREPELNGSERFCACHKVFRLDGAFVPPHETPMSIAIREGKSFRNVEAAVERPDGSRFFAAVNIDPLLDERGRICGAINVFQDVTEKVRAREILEQTVAERTASLSEAVAQMEEFSYSVSHDLRAPLRAMKAYAAFLLEDYGGKLDLTGRGYLEKIQRSSDRMDRLTKDVLTYSRIARTQVQLEPLSVENVVKDIIHQYAYLQPPAAYVEIDTPLLDVLGHETTFGQCVANLLNNAAKFVLPGIKPRLRIRTEPRGENVRIWFEDNGIGIQPKYQNRIFQMFERLHPEGNYEGTGIGLTIVRKAVDKMGGKVGVESDGQTGSRFWIELRGVPLA